MILCTPVGTFATLAAEIAPHLAPGAILTDAGSVKTAAVRDIGPHVPAGVHFVPGHPIAGTEYSGPEAGFAELYEGRWCILTPLARCDEQAVAKLKAFWEACGSQVEIMTPEHHDLVLAVTSHVPHLIAYNIVRERFQTWNASRKRKSSSFRLRASATSRASPRPTRPCGATYS